jgi:hypothetical protein
VQTPMKRIPPTRQTDHSLSGRSGPFEVTYGVREILAQRESLSGSPIGSGTSD